MKTIFAITPLHAFAVAQPTEPGLRLALTQPPEYLEALGSLAVMLEAKRRHAPNHVVGFSTPSQQDRGHAISTTGVSRPSFHRERA